MKTILRRLRGIFGSVVAWGSAWFAGSLVISLTLGLIWTARQSRWDIWGTLDIWYGLFWSAGSTAVIGAMTGGAFAAYIAANFSDKQIEDLRPGRFAFFGGSIAILLRLLFDSTETIAAGHALRHIPLEWLWDNLVFLGVAGALTGFVSLKLAQRGQLAGGEEAGRLAPESTTLLPEP